MAFISSQVQIKIPPPFILEGEKGGEGEKKKKRERKKYGFVTPFFYTLLPACAPTRDGAPILALGHDSLTN